MYINQQDAQNSCDYILFFIDALHVSDYISPSSGATFISCTRYTAVGIYRYVWLLCGYSHTPARRMVPAYTKYDVRLIKVAPDDGLI